MRRRLPKPARLNRDLERVLEDLAAEFPLLEALVERRPGSQKRLPIEDGREGKAMRPLLSLIRKAEAERDIVAIPTSLRLFHRRPTLAGTQQRAAGTAPETVPAHEAAALPGSGTTRRRTQYRPVAPIRGASRR